MTWNGEDYPFDAWEANQTLSSAMKNSVNWYFQSIDSQLGFHSVKSFLQKIQYGNQQTGSDIDLYWTDLSLKISPIEQVNLLKKFHDNEFQFAPQNIDAVKMLWSSIFVTLMANKIGGLQFGIYRNCQISSRVFHTAVAALPLTKANRSDFE